VRRRAALACLLAGPLAFAGEASAQGGAARSSGPAFDCKAAGLGSIEKLVCADPALAALDRKLAALYRQAQKKAVNEHPPVLRATQRGWVKGRNDCWKAVDRRDCTMQSYIFRSIELQTGYRLAPMRGPYTFACEGDPRNEVIVNYFDTTPASLVAERGDSVSMMIQEPVASGTLYTGRNEAIREHQGEAMIRWGYGAPEMRCVPK
jgi:uncharacterized protein